MSVRIDKDIRIHKEQRKHSARLYVPNQRRRLYTQTDEVYLRTLQKQIAKAGQRRRKIFYHLPHKRRYRIDKKLDNGRLPHIDGGIRAVHSDDRRTDGVAFLFRFISSS